MVVVGFLIYGLGLAPAYYSWGFLAPELIDDLGLTREQIGNTFGVFTLTFAVTRPCWGPATVLALGVTAPSSARTSCASRSPASWTGSGRAGPGPWRTGPARTRAPSSC
jgi:hypothetical protein